MLFAPVEHPNNVVGQALIVIAGCWLTRSAIAPSGNAVDVPPMSQLGREVVKDMCGVSGPHQQDDRPAAASPIESLQPDAFLHGYEADPVFGRVVPERQLVRLWQERSVVQFRIGKPLKTSHRSPQKPRACPRIERAVTLTTGAYSDRGLGLLTVTMDQPPERSTARPGLC
jgi:hypothetical protein